MPNTQPASKKTCFMFVPEYCKKAAVKYSIEKRILLNFANLTTMFRLRLYEETYFHPEVSDSMEVIFSVDLSISKLERFIHT